MNQSEALAFAHDADLLGVRSKADLCDLARDRETLRQIEARLRDEARAAAIAAFGHTTGTAMCAGISALGGMTLLDTVNTWRAAAATDPTTAATTVTTPAAPTDEGRNPSHAGGNHAARPLRTGAGQQHTGRMWDRLTPEQQAYGTKIGMTTPEKREQFAKDYCEAAGAQ